MSDLHSLLTKNSSPEEMIIKITELLQHDKTLDCFGSFSASIYDTAWVSMVRRKGYPADQWLSPRSYEFILSSQLADGTWESYRSPVDGILNTLASLLALLVHQAVDGEKDITLSGRIQKASEGLRALLRAWSVEDTLHVGFEVLVPCLLSMAAKFDFHFEFPGQRLLQDLHQKKIAKFKPEIVYSSQSTTILHSLESLVGTIDFDKVTHHCTEANGIFGSPAATAAYLINCSTWDVSAEAYLKRVIDETVDGGVPSAFPTSIFESSWAISVLLEGAVDENSLSPSIVQALASFYQLVMARQAGVVGFAPSILEDADDTARVLLTLHRLGIQTDLQPMINTFNSSTCFRTYQLEGSPSFSANCNVLLAIMSHKYANRHSEIVERTVKYLLDAWNAGKMVDKWNLSPFYSSMLLANVLVSLLECINSGHITDLSAHVSKIDIPIVLCQILYKTLGLQTSTGAWGNCVEENAYAMIIIARCCKLPWGTEVANELITSYRKAFDWMTANAELNHRLPDYLWVEKVTYGSALLKRVYRITAVNMRTEQGRWEEHITGSLAELQDYALQIRPLLSQLPLFAESTMRHIGLALIEASRLTERLQISRNIIFPRDKLPMSKDKYLKFISVIWTVCNHRQALAISSDCMWEMIFVSMLNFQVDEYMETATQALSGSELSFLFSKIQESCGVNGTKDEYFGSQGNIATTLHDIPDIPATTTEPTHCIDSPLQSDTSSPDSPLAPASIIGGYISHIRNHPAVLNTPKDDQDSLGASLYAFLISHIAQNINSYAYYQGKRLLPGAQRGFSTWVRTTAADSTSCPFSFQFFAMLLGNHFSSNPRIQYLAQALASHLAILCRMYNDCGSFTRDSAEKNLNGLDFPEFRAMRAEGNKGLNTAKETLLGLAEFERGGMERALQALEAELGNQRIMRAVRVFVDVTDMFGQIYVVKDIASRVKARGKSG